MSPHQFKIFCCRHGQDQDNEASLLNGHRNQPLTALGEKQAQQAAEKIATTTEWGPNLDFIFSSPLQRANKTAKTIFSAVVKQQQEKQQKQLLQTDDVVVLQNLIERDFGSFTGKPLSDITKLKEEQPDNVLVTDKVNYFLNVDGAEDFDTLLKRAKSVIEEAKQYALANYKNKQQQEANDDDTVTTVTTTISILLVCHGDLMKMMLAVAKNLTWKEALMAPYIANTDYLELQ